mmetsp:Transcript_53411/g.85324  ORF Transcript_53411/g.85324 Transcript_53411/m.85324 type:complete len:261 (-) Transcript_53411:109-891(-)|eukprot:CAMPEP_0197055292 /NCGR_PEP_ID=MMETSP1384-20130603/61760_1 /TAXON_ID=29189 /ORGANISM="Ammonia sp." /LENGTH=260 /DNA_ID=CAMNT_0042488807 /DNA_START=31 /DNA_END=813 /DNA_ORIENTATION=-
MLSFPFFLVTWTIAKAQDQVRPGYNYQCLHSDGGMYYIPVQCCRTSDSCSPQPSSEYIQVQAYHEDYGLPAKQAIQMTSYFDCATTSFSNSQSDRYYFTFSCANWRAWCDELGCWDTQPPSAEPSAYPSVEPTEYPTAVPSVQPTEYPSQFPSAQLTASSIVPTGGAAPSAAVSENHSAAGSGDKDEELEHEGIAFLVGASAVILVVMAAWSCRRWWLKRRGRWSFEDEEKYKKQMTSSLELIQTMTTEVVAGREEETEE